MYFDRTAVKSANQVLTYDELNKAANIVARAMLPECGEGNEPVALLFDHGAAGQPKVILQSHRNLLQNVLIHTNEAS